MGSLATSLANDYVIVDDLQTITYLWRNPAAIDVSLTITNADGHELSAKEIAGSNGFFQLGDKRWSLGNNQFPASTKPKPGDQITDAAGVNWEVKDATLDDFGISWMCTTAKAR